MNKLLIYQASILLVLYLGYGFYYFTRKSVIFMLPHFHLNETSHFNITKNDIGIIISSQNFAYAISKLIGGILSDVVSCRILFGSGLFLSGLLNIGFKKDIQVYSLYSISFLIGLTQGPAWPCCGKLLQNWLPKSLFGTWWSILSTSANVAGALGPLVTTWISIKYHWSYGFMIPGCICMSVGYLAIIILRNQPSEIGFQNFNDEDNVNESEENVEEKARDDNYETHELTDDDISLFSKIRMLFSYPFFISICISYFMVQLIKTLFSDWSQMYLIKSFKLTTYNASYFVSVFEISGILGSIISGVLTDYIYYKKKKNFDENMSKEKQSIIKPESIKIRMFVNIIYILGLIICLHLFNYFVYVNVNQLFLIFIGSLAGFFCYGSISLLGVIAMEFTPKSFSGSSHAIASLSANLGSIFAGIPFGLISKYYSWKTGFRLVELFTLVIILFLVFTKNSKSKFELNSNKNIELKENKKIN